LFHNCAIVFVISLHAPAGHFTGKKPNEMAFRSKGTICAFAIGTKRTSGTLLPLIIPTYKMLLWNMAAWQREGA
jgi:hypothetical protein